MLTTWHWPIAPKSSKIAEENLSKDMHIICDNLKHWKLKLSVNKTFASSFHIRNHLANYQIKVKIPFDNVLKCETNPKYLGIKLDRSLTFKPHLTDLKNKVATRVALVKRLANLSWGASHNILRTSSLALVFPPQSTAHPPGAAVLTATWLILNFTKQCEQLMAASCQPH